MNALIGKMRPASFEVIVLADTIIQDAQKGIAENAAYKRWSKAKIHFRFGNRCGGATIF